MRIAWRTVGSIIARVVADGRAAHDPFSGLVRIGIDEISYKKGHRYLTIVVDHDSGRLVWAAVGRDKVTLHGFFDLLGEERSAEISLVSADGAEWIAGVVAERAGNATLCIDAFHVVAWATDALDEVRRQVWNEARKGGMSTHAKELKGCRYALWRNPEDLESFYFAFGDTDVYLIVDIPDNASVAAAATARCPTPSDAPAHWSAPSRIRWPRYPDRGCSRSASANSRSTPGIWPSHSGNVPDSAPLQTRLLDLSGRRP